MRASPQRPLALLAIRHIVATFTTVDMVASEESPVSMHREVDRLFKQLVETCVGAKWFARKSYPASGSQEEADLETVLHLVEDWTENESQVERWSLGFSTGSLNL